MIELESSRLFTPWTHPKTGATIYLLTERVAPVQEAFYFVNDSMTRDGRYLWFYCAYPPSGSSGQGRTLGLVDFEEDTVRRYPETQLQGGPFVDPHPPRDYDRQAAPKCLQICACQASIARVMVL